MKIDLDKFFWTEYSVPTHMLKDFSLKYIKDLAKFLRFNMKILYGKRKRLHSHTFNVIMDKGKITNIVVKG